MELQDSTKMATITRLMNEAPQPDIDIESIDKDLISDWVLLKTPYPVVSILLVYLIMLILGPRFMASREPYNMRIIMRVYDALQVILNLYIFLGFSIYPDRILKLSRRVCSLEEEGNYNYMVPVTMVYGWRYLVVKILDLLDTMFMILRKKNSHITFLHVYHHSAMVFFTYFTFTRDNGPHGVTIGGINVLVHIVMYSYYFLATFPQLEKYLWWKKHLTKLQLGQFVVILTYVSLLYINGCPISRTFTYVWLFNISVILMLFMNFYIKAYMNRSPLDKQKKKPFKNP